MTTRKMQVLFMSLCATVVSVGFWTVAILVNLLNWLFGKAEFVLPLARAIVALSTLGFFLLFYRHFDRTVPPSNQDFD